MTIYEGCGLVAALAIAFAAGVAATLLAQTIGLLGTVGLGLVVIAVVWFIGGTR